MNTDIPPPKRLYCPDCEEETVYKYAGDNTGGRPVRKCVKCGEPRPGFLSAKPTAEVATDGGPHAGGGET